MAFFGFFGVESAPPWLRRGSGKGFHYRIWTHRFRAGDGFVFGSFLGRLGPACRCVWAIWGVEKARARVRKRRARCDKSRGRRAAAFPRLEGLASEPCVGAGRGL